MQEGTETDQKVVISDVGISKKSEGFTACYHGHSRISVCERQCARSDSVHDRVCKRGREAEGLTACNLGHS